MKFPRHVAIIMDGNGRWAKQRGLPRIAGHEVGAESVRAIVKACTKKKISVLTLFAFSTENWQRPQEEVSYLIGNLFVKALKDEVKKLHKNNVRFSVVGDTKRLTKNLRKRIETAEKLTANNTGLKLVIAMSYSGHWDITEAARKLCEKIEAKKMLAQDVTVEKLKRHICLNNLPDPDLLIRTGGERRISNFLLWQIAYTELYFTDVLWPDFREAEFIEALTAYSQRIRRFGKC